MSGLDTILVIIKLLDSDVDRIRSESQLLTCAFDDLPAGVQDGLLLS